MFRFLLLLVLLLPRAAQAQERDGIFENYDAYAAYVDRHVMKRDFIPMIQRLGGRDEYTPEQLSSVNIQLLNAFPADFPNVATFRQVDLGNGFRQEARAYWNGSNYAFFYALTHQRENDFMILKFNLNSSSDAIMERF